MRSCPICESPKRELVIPKYNSPTWELFRCKCGMLYVDSHDATEEKMNQFYLSNYQSSDGEPAAIRLDSLASFIRDVCLPPMMDIGGEDNELAKRIALPIDISGAGAVFTKQYATFILSHTLEHVYNVPGMMQKIKDYILPRGLVVIEVPIWKGDEDLHKYDYHHLHLNKFTPDKLEELFRKHGFSIELSGYLPRYIEYDCYRLLARHA